MLAALALLHVMPLPADTVPMPSAQVQASAEEVLQLADVLQTKGDVQAAKALYQGLLSDPSRAIRNEARFRLAALKANDKDWAASALLLRRILDEQPDALVARVELASMLEKLGDEAAARRELRAAQAGHPPAPLSRQIDRYAAALRDRRPFGGSIKMAIAPDSNINRATLQDRLQTVIGDFTIDRAGQAQSGVGVAAEVSGFARQPLTGNVALLVQGGLRTTTFGRRQFNRAASAIRAGAQMQIEGHRIAVALSHQRYAIGGREYLTSKGLEADYSRPLSGTAQFRTSVSVSRLKNRIHGLENGTSSLVSASVDAALSPNSGVSVTLSGNRRTARDRAYATRSGEIGLSAWREIGRLTIGASGSFGMLGADRRLNLLPSRREDRSWSANLSLSSRHVVLLNAAPSVRLTFEHHRSTIEFYDIRRRAIEVALTRAF